MPENRCRWLKLGSFKNEISNLVSMKSTLGHFIFSFPTKTVWTNGSPTGKANWNFRKQSVKAKYCSRYCYPSALANLSTVLEINDSIECAGQVKSGNTVNTNVTRTQSQHKKRKRCLPDRKTNLPMYDRRTCVLNVKKRSDREVRVQSRKISGV